MSKILIIGVGGGALNAVNRMKKEGILGASYIGIGIHDAVFAKEIPYYDLYRMNGSPNLSPGSSKKLARRFAENVEEEIGEIIDKHLKD